jgi:hypothetical protein
MIKILVLTLLLTLSGCGVSKWINENPYLSDVGSKQAVARYIEAGDTPEQEQARVQGVLAWVSVGELYLTGESATKAGLVALLTQSVNWDGMSVADRLLIEDLVFAVGDSVDVEVPDAPLSDEDREAFVRLFANVRRIASYYAETSPDV